MKEITINFTAMDNNQVLYPIMNKITLSKTKLISTIQSRKRDYIREIFIPK